MFIKILGAVLVIYATTMLGIHKVQVLRKRKQILEHFNNALLILKNEIRFKMSPLYEAGQIAAAAQPGIIGTLLAHLSEAICEKRGESVSDIWRQGMKEQNMDKHLSESEMKIMILFGDRLGASDLEGETANIDNTAFRIDECIKKIGEKIEKDNKIYKNMGFLSGVLIVLLLF